MAEEMTFEVIKDEIDHKQWSEYGRKVLREQGLYKAYITGNWCFDGVPSARGHTEDEAKRNAMKLAAEWIRDLEDTVRRGKEFLQANGYEPGEV